MSALLQHPDDWFLLGLIIGAPLFGAFMNGVFGKRLGKEAVRLMALASTGVSFAAAVYTFVSLHALRHRAEEIALQAWQAAHAGQTPPHEIAVPPTRLAWLAWKWFAMASPDGGGRLAIDVRFSVDELSAVMMLIVTGVGFLIHVYATSYMAKDPGYHRFFAYLNLFMFAMLTLVLADNMPLMFVGWEGVGLCSYLLIGFWYEDIANSAAGRKAFIANRIGDVGMIGAMLVIAHYTGALDWEGINKGAEHLVDPSSRIVLFQRTIGHLSVAPATVACLSIFLACTGKSAQIPLYVWLPDAMAGPTPVSALIHAATMVTSGLYLICRMNVVFTFSPFAMMVVAVVGALTALFAATIALVQNDIKKVLAYSTVSQLGFMFLGVGVGAFGMGFFHVLTHSFFKACLFLGAGSVIHAMHARIHDAVKSQDLRQMGGLRKYMPWTWYSMTAATVAIAGFPLTSGFFSKDGILFHAWSNRVVHPYKATAEAVLKEYAAKGMTDAAPYKRALLDVAGYFEAPAWLGRLLFAIGIAAATCTAFYMFRLLFKTFWGDFRGWAVDPAITPATNPFENTEPLEDEELTHDQHDHHDVDVTKPAAPPSEAPWEMAIPVAILGALALVAGFLWAEPIHIEPLGHWLSPVFREASEASVHLREGAQKPEWLEWPLMVPGVLAALGGAWVAWLWYVKGGERTPAELARAWPRLYLAAYNKWYVDEVYDATVIGGTDALADGAALMDTWIVDGIIARLSAAIVSALGALLRSFQTGVVHVYAATMAIGVLLLFLFFGRPHPEVSMKKEGAGDLVTFSLEAAPGLGYEYRWDLGDGTRDEGFSSGDDASKRVVTVPADQIKTIVLEVKNAFGRTVKRTFELGNPKPSASPTASPAGK